MQRKCRMSMSTTGPDEACSSLMQVNRIIPSLMKGNVDAAKAAEELATHVRSSGKRSAAAAGCCCC